MGKRILIVDDDVDFGESVKTVLEFDGYRVETTTAGAEGLSAAEKNRPDLIVLDVMMEHTTAGFDVSRELHNRPSLRDVPVILVTGISRELNLPFSFEADEHYLPVREVVEKPVDPKLLLEKVHAVLAEDTHTASQPDERRLG